MIPTYILLLITLSLKFWFTEPQYSSSNLNESYVKNISTNPKVIVIRHTGDNGLTLICEGKGQPTRWAWVWAESEGPTVEVSKERTSDNRYISSLNIKFENVQSGSLIHNLSCLFESEFERRKTNLVSCVSISDSSKTQSAPLENVTKIKFNDCFPNQDTAVGFSYMLNINLKTNSAICDPVKLRMRPGTQPCPNIDICDSMGMLKSNVEPPNQNVSFVNDSSQAGNFTGLDTKSNSSILLLFCKPDYDDIAWSSFAIAYRGFNRTRTSWLQFEYYESRETALDGNGIKLPGSWREVRQSFASNSIVVRTDFAMNETVEFACLAMKSLFMEGFMWEVQNMEHEGTNQVDEIREAEHLYVWKRNITLNYPKGNLNIMCKGPVWNSYKWNNASLNIRLSPHSKPWVKLLKQERLQEGKHEINCTYGGWPRPDLTWIFSENVTAETINGTNGKVPNQTWYEVKVFERQIKSIKINCSVKYTLNNGSNTYSAHAVDDIAGIGNKWLTPVIISAAIIVCALIIGFVVLFWRYRRNQQLYNQQKNLTTEEISEFYSGARKSSTTYEALQLPYNSDYYEISQDRLSFEDSILGSGQFGLVYKGSVGSLTVAVKTIKPTADLIYLKSLLSELKILQHIGRHPNIVNLIGANTQNLKNREAFLVLDYCSNGNLVNFLRQCRDRFVNVFDFSSHQENLWPIYENSREITLNTGNLLAFSYEIASAMDYLASKNTIHGDLAARNVLITDDIHAKICDFGLAKQLLHYSVYVQKIDCPLPLRWMAIESLQDMEFSLASDKWSYGICLWEIFSLAELPYPGVQWSFESYKMLKDGYRMEKPQYANASIHKLMLKCWSEKPQDRPKFDYIVNLLKEEEDRLT